MDDFSQNTLHKANINNVPSKIPKFKKLLPFAIGLPLLILIAVGIFLYTRSPQLQFLLLSRINGVSATSLAQKAAQDETKKLVDEVGKIMELPTNETPTIATVTDMTKLKNQAFFLNAKNGEKVLIYPNNKKAILYDPVEKKIVNVGPLNNVPQQSQAKIIIRNGTASPGLTNKIEDEIKKTYSDINVISKENAANSQYSTTLVIALNDSAKDAASLLAKTINANVVNLPTQEQRPNDGDILVIVGQDKI